MKQRISALALAFVLAGCASGISTTQDFSPGADFTGLQTFDFMPEPPRVRETRADNDLVDERFKNALVEVLEDKGFRKVDSGRPDFRVGYHLTLEDEVDYQTLNTYWGGSWRYGGPTVATRSVQERRYTVGTLIIDVFDVASQELVWRGSGEGRVSADARTPEERQERVTEAVYRVLDRFPPN